MTKQQLKRKSEGFTIIEVLIVLAIAGLIMLIVFLAVPALQRNQRNNARNSDASKIAAAVTECLANRNGSTATSGNGCAVVANLNTGGLNTLTTVTAGGATADGTSTTGATVRFNVQCDAEGVRSATGAAPSTKAFTVTYVLEPSVQRCING